DRLDWSSAAMLARLNDPQAGLVIGILLSAWHIVEYARLATDTPERASNHAGSLQQPHEHSRASPSQIVERCSISTN
ncbi:MAG: hypothetical protein VB036_04685, partial [Propionicimonas sp.]|nr:hypothetical protein [Propionicimonas sp.]